MRRPFLLVLTILSLGGAAACKQDRRGDAPDLASRLPPGLESRFWPPKGWAWGALQVGRRPYLRYGVSAGPAIPLATVIILPGYGESAEQWFETISALNVADYDVWVLEGAGQGGSARYTAVTDLGHVPNFDADVLALPALLRHVIRPPKGKPVYVVASGTAWLPALASFEHGAPADRLILSDPMELPTPPASAKAGSKTTMADGQMAWRRPDLTRLPRRQRAAAAWALANPDLRMGGASRGWFAARDALRSDTLQPAKLQSLKTPMLVLDQGHAVTPCAAMPHCIQQAVAGSLPYQQAPDADRDSWLAALFAGLAPDHPP